MIVKIPSTPPVHKLHRRKSFQRNEEEEANPFDRENERIAQIKNRHCKRHTRRTCWRCSTVRLLVVVPVKAAAHGTELQPLRRRISARGHYSNWGGGACCVPCAFLSVHCRLRATTADFCHTGLRCRTHGGFGVWINRRGAESKEPSSSYYLHVMRLCLFTAESQAYYDLFFIQTQTYGIAARNFMWSCFPATICREL